MSFLSHHHTGEQQKETTDQVILPVQRHEIVDSEALLEKSRR